MKQFIYKTSFFVIPITLLYCITAMFYNVTEGDLLRLGYIPHIYKSYRTKFSLSQEEKFDKLSQHKAKKYQILTIGDSFSEQDGFGYKNMLADDFSVLHVDRFISNNQIQTLINFANGDFFDKYDIEYVVLQNVERHFIENIQNIHLNDKITLSELNSMISNHKVKQGDALYKFFSKTTIKFPLYDFPKFFLMKNYVAHELVYNMELNTSSLFSNKSNKLLFYYLDPISAKKNNIKENIDSLNVILNTVASKLSQRNIKLIVLPAPDKYDLYYDFIADKSKFSFEKPVFFDLMKPQKKEYIYIDAKSILLSKMKKEQDIYFYDDTHWSPIASKIIADEIKNKIKNN